MLVLPLEPPGFSYGVVQRRLHREGTGGFPDGRWTKIRERIATLAFGARTVQPLNLLEPRRQHPLFPLAGETCNEALPGKFGPSVSAAKEAGVTLRARSTAAE